MNWFHYALVALYLAVGLPAIVALCNSLTKEGRRDSGWFAWSLRLWVLLIIILAGVMLWLVSQVGG